MAGSAISPMVTTVAPTMPVDAASKAPTTTTETASPPRKLPNSRPISVNRSSAIRERSRMVPISTKSGIAISTWLVITPKMRCANARSSVRSKTPMAKPRKANSTPRPAIRKATG